MTWWQSKNKKGNFEKVEIVRYNFTVTLLFNSIRVYLYSAFHNTNHGKAALHEIKFLQYI